MGVNHATKRKGGSKMFVVMSKDTNKTHQTKTRGEALIWATVEHNRTKKETGQNIKFIIKEI